MEKIKNERNPPWRKNITAEISLANDGKKENADRHNKQIKSLTEPQNILMYTNGSRLDSGATEAEI